VTYVVLPPKLRHPTIAGSAAAARNKISTRNRVDITRVPQTRRSEKKPKDENWAAIILEVEKHVKGNFPFVETYPTCAISA
jgi:hypothetical protein